MGSVSSELKKNIMSVMEDEQERNISKLKIDLASEKDFKYGRDFGEGHLAGILRVLTTNGELEKTGRGRYKLGKKGLFQQQIMPATGVDFMINFVSGEGENAQETMILVEMKQQALTGLEEQYRNLVRCMDTVALSSLSSADFESLKQLSEVKEDLKTLLAKHGRISS